VAIYAIWLNGQLDPAWAEWFDSMTITNCRGGLAVLTGDIVDQADLHGRTQQDQKSEPAFDLADLHRAWSRSVPREESGSRRRSCSLVATFPHTP
jgi:hypothetical protein